ncbi:HD domain-containing phosphohydrolase [Rosistilla oblonga]|uniref:HD domain-containing phosphohydrolase n=1 Tax=Rosistilla oblonga TaxID=2527990 RepID=UPI003A97B38E
MTLRVLFVDDNQKVLNSIARQFEGVLDYETANGPHEAIELLDPENPFAVVVSDMRMPKMNGAELLTHVRKVSPETVRIMLSGYADLQATIQAVNEGNIARFLSKPCPRELLERAIREGLDQYQLVTGQRELLEGTLQGSVTVLCAILSLVHPLAFGRVSQVQRIALAIGDQMQLESIWDLKIASMLFPLGCVSLSERALECMLEGIPVPSEERSAYEQHPSVARAMLQEIPRLDNVAAIVAYQEKGFDGSGLPIDEIAGPDIPIGARVLKAALDFEIAMKQTSDATTALEKLLQSPAGYDPEVLDALRQQIEAGFCQRSQRTVPLAELRTGMVLAADVRLEGGKLVAASGQEVTDSIRRNLETFCEFGQIEGSFEIESVGGAENAECEAVC